jgi:hypothetical protein
VPFSNLNHSKILDDLLRQEHQENNGKNLNEYFEAYVSDLESRNIENVDHFKQLIAHENQIIKSSNKNSKNL